MFREFSSCLVCRPNYIWSAVSLFLLFLFASPVPVEGGSSRDKRKIRLCKKQARKLKKDIRKLKLDLIEARRPVPLPDFLEMVLVGDPGNSADAGNTSDPGIFGSVGYSFKIGRAEVTNEQWVKFLNAVAATDPNGLYSTNMTNNARGGITRMGSSGNYVYDTRPFRADKPVNFVNWYDAVRFCNWLHNNRPSGVQDATTTEDGAYTLAGPSSVDPGSDPDHGADGRNAGARFFLPSENEWYKAAYFEPGGDSDDYWKYATRSNDPPTEASVDAAGNVGNSGENVINHNHGADWNGQDGNVTSVATCGVDSASYYGAYDMSGNLREWTEARDAATRITRGGTWGGTSNENSSAVAVDTDPTSAGTLGGVGFRVAGAVD